MKELLEEVALRAARYASGMATRRVAPSPEAVERLAALGGALPESPSDPATVLTLLDDIGSPATVATTGGRYFGFVTGGALPAALAANWLAGIWDQNAAFSVMSPVAAKIEEIALTWLRGVFGLPASCEAGFVTGAKETVQAGEGFKRTRASVPPYLRRRTPDVCGVIDERCATSRALFLENHRKALLFVDQGQTGNARSRCSQSMGAHFETVTTA
ncbi:MAG TPA: hypothetical protein VNE63_00820 [Candidatus Acidoferrales bacterium]|nr:hypothetical protein [Candidatus Acidoferrales bacterium]